MDATCRQPVSAVISLSVNDKKKKKTYIVFQNRHSIIKHNVTFLKCVNIFVPSIWSKNPNLSNVYSHVLKVLYIIW